MTQKTLDLIINNIWQPRTDKSNITGNHVNNSPTIKLSSLKQISDYNQNKLTQVSYNSKPNTEPSKENTAHSSTPIINKQDIANSHLNKTITQITLDNGDIPDWNTLVNQIQACEKCKLSSARRHVVIERGSRNAQWMFIGEAPGEQEDIQGKPFVGTSGQLLDKMISAMKLDHNEDIYIANVIKCRPPRNRNPEIEEIKACNNFLKKQIELINPKIIITLGRYAAQTLLNTELAVGKLRGKINYFANTPVIVTYHPSYLLRTPEAKKEAWNDLQLAMQTFQELC